MNSFEPETQFDRNVNIPSSPPSILVETLSSTHQNPESLSTEQKNAAARIYYTNLLNANPSLLQLPPDKREVAVSELLKTQSELGQTRITTTTALANLTRLNDLFEQQISQSIDSNSPTVLTAELIQELGGYDDKGYLIEEFVAMFSTPQDPLFHAGALVRHEFGGMLPTSFLTFIMKFSKTSDRYSTVIGMARNKLRISINFLGLLNKLVVPKYVETPQEPTIGLGDFITVIPNIANINFYHNGTKQDPKEPANPTEESNVNFTLVEFLAIRTILLNAERLIIPNGNVAEKPIRVDIIDLGDGYKSFVIDDNIQASTGEVIWPDGVGMPPQLIKEGYDKTIASPDLPSDNSQRGTRMTGILVAAGTIQNKGLVHIQLVQQEGILLELGVELPEVINAQVIAINKRLPVGRKSMQLVSKR